MIGFYVLPLPTHRRKMPQTPTDVARFVLEAAVDPEVVPLPTTLARFVC